jgi:hypothetical protein
LPSRAIEKAAHAHFNARHQFTALQHAPLKDSFDPRRSKGDILLFDQPETFGDYTESYRKHVAPQPGTHAGRLRIRSIMAIIAISFSFVNGSQTRASTSRV